MEIEILTVNYWKNFKYIKDLHKIYTPDHPKIVKLNKELNELLDRINLLKIHKKK